MSGHHSIRRRTAEDLDQAARALVEVHASDGYPVEGVDDPVAWLTDPAPTAAWVADHDGTIVGHVAVSPPNGDAAVAHWRDHHPGEHHQLGVIGRLFVVPSARGDNLGEHLMQAATDYADDHGITLVLDVMAKDRAAIRLYERLGWTRIGHTTHTYGDGHRVPAYTYQRPSPA